MINLVFKTVLAALNKNQMGKISPSEFNTFLSEVLNKIYSELFADYRKLAFRKMKFQDSAGYGNETFNLKQAIEFYISSKEIVADTSGNYTLPENIMLMSSIFDENILYEKTDKSTFEVLKRSKKMKPTSCSPIYTLNDGSIKVFPPKDKIEVNYFRKIKEPKWTYIVANGIEMYNPDAQDFQDIDMHPMMLSRIFNDVLSLCGLNLQAQQVQEYVNLMKQESMINKQ